MLYIIVKGFTKTFILDTFPRPISCLEVDDSPSLPASPSSTRAAFNDNDHCPPSQTCSSPSSSVAAFSESITTSTLLPSATVNSYVSIKAIHDTSIILLRVPRRIEFAEIRQRLYNKFIGQEGIPLSPTYNVVFVPPSNPPASPPPGRGRSRVTTTTTLSNRTPDVITLDSESDWERLMLTVQDNKITLRIQDT